VRQLCCRFLFSPVFPQRPPPPALSASKERANKSFSFLFLQTPKSTGFTEKSFKINQLLAFWENREGGVFPAEQKKAGD
jgi:hypothetical protein